MSELIVPTTRVTKIYPHPNADKLDFIEVQGWRCIVSRGSVEKGDWGAYFPIDSVLPDNIMNVAFKDAKIKPKDGRVKTVKIRGEIAQGLFLPRKLLPVFPAYPQEGQDLAEVLQVTKYEPPVKELPLCMQTSKKGTRKKANPNFKEYTNLQHLKWFANVFEVGEPVAITEKVHGTSARYGFVPTVADTWWKRLKAAIGLLPKFEFVYGSRKVQLQSKSHRTTSYYGTDVWGSMCEQLNLPGVLEEGEVVYGEIYGPGIQKGYDYGVPAGERRFVVYDVQKDGRFLNHNELVAWCAETGLAMVPTLYTGPFSDTEVEVATNGNSLLDIGTKVREGCVVRPMVERHTVNGRAIYKCVSPAFLLGDQTDFH